MEKPYRMQSSPQLTQSKAHNIRYRAPHTLQDPLFKYLLNQVLPAGVRQTKKYPPNPHTSRRARNSSLSIPAVIVPHGVHRAGLCEQRKKSLASASDRSDSRASRSAGLRVRSENGQASVLVTGETAGVDGKGMVSASCDCQEE